MDVQFMLALGVYGVAKAIKNERLRKQLEEEEAAAAALRSTPGPTTALVNGEAAEKDGGGAATAEAAAAKAAAKAADGHVGNGTSASGSSAETLASSFRDSVGRQEEDGKIAIELSQAGSRRHDGGGPDVEAGRGGPIGGSAGEAKAEGIGAEQDSIGAGSSVVSGCPHDPQAAAEQPLIFLDRRCEHAEHWVLRHCRCIRAIDIESPVVQRVVAFGVGIVHGIAGPGGILGVLPAVQLHSWAKATLYLGTFCFASTLIMGVFAALYGEATSRIGSAKKCEFRLELFSASLSIIVGVLWIALIVAGKLNVVFG